MAILNYYFYANVHTADKKIVFEKIGTRLFYVFEDYDIEHIYRKLRKRGSGVFVINSARGRRLAKVIINNGRSF